MSFVDPATRSSSLDACRCSTTPVARLVVEVPEQQELRLPLLHDRRELVLSAQLLVCLRVDPDVVAHEESDVLGDGDP